MGPQSSTTAATPIVGSTPPSRSAWPSCDSLAADLFDRTMPDPSSSLAPVASLDADAEPRRRFSEVLNDLASRPEAAIRLSDVLNAFGDRAFGALMLLFAA